jgi:GDP-L-fucose synthase
VAKIAGIEMCWDFNRQYGTSFLAAMPTNLYGPGDNYDLRDSHVIPALIRKMHEAKLNGNSKVEIWGTGKPRREFLYSDDLAEACVFLMQLGTREFAAMTIRHDQAPIVNIGCGEDLTVGELAEVVAKVVGYQGTLVFDTTKPDGTPRKLLDVSRMQSLGWAPRTSLASGLAATYGAFVSRQAQTTSAEGQLTARI